MLNNKMATESYEISIRETEHAKLSADIAAQGIVLLENSGILPFAKSIKSIALYGSGARRTVKGGTGSGDVNVRTFVNVETGLKKAGYYVVTNGYLDEYEVNVNTARAEYNRKIKEIAKQGAFNGLIAMMSNPFKTPSSRSLNEEDIEKYAADAAVYVLSRNSGEGADRKAIEGDYYLSKEELSDIKLLAKKCRCFVLLFNVGGVVDVSEIRKIEGIGAILLIGQGGIGAGDAVADVLSGKVTPSGKLTATWAKSYDDYPFSKEYAVDQFDSVYKEGIYVGYRYFSTFGIEPAYSFGFGLSYTDFRLIADRWIVSGNKLSCEITVQNTGTRFSGREVVQIYAQLPNKELPQPSKILCAFNKTKLLKPGEKEILKMAFPLDRLACYDEKISSWILGKGTYVLYYGNDSERIFPFVRIAIADTVILEKCNNLLRGENVDELVGNEIEESIRIDLPCLSVQTDALKSVEHSYSTDIRHSTLTITDVNFSQLIDGSVTAEELVSELSIPELATLCVGATRINISDITVVGNFSDSLPGAAGETTHDLNSRGIPSVSMADGPAGIRINPVIHEKNGGYVKMPEEDPIFRYLIPDDFKPTDLTGTSTKYQYCTAIPVATTLAQTWDTELLERAGQMIGDELSLLDIDLWLAPGMNIQRNPLCGRNFEYFSEDPLLSGLCAAAMTKGVQSRPGKGVTIKHFAANNQETNRNFNNSHLSERTLREIYLRGFEVCIKESMPLAVMTSLNLINGVHAAGDRQLLTDVLRREWGFDGIVMTDWGTTGVPGSNKTQKYDCTYAVDCITAGNDLIMPGSQRDLDYIITSANNGLLPIENLRRCAANVVKMICRTCTKRSDHGNVRS